MDESDRLGDPIAYEEAFKFKLAEVNFFADKVASLKLSLEKPFLGAEYTDSVHQQIVAEAQRICEQSAYYYDALLSSSFSALDTFAHVYSVIVSIAARRNTNPITRKSIHFPAWYRRFRNKIKSIDESELGETERDALDKFEEAVKFFRVLRESRNFYMHQKHVLQDLNAPCGFVSATDGEISSVNLPPIRSLQGEPILLDKDAENIVSALEQFDQSAQRLRDILTVEFR